MLFGDEAVTRLAQSRVAVFGIGGVGGYVVEVLARSGVGEIHLFDNDIVSETNLNRQIVALRSTIGQYKTEVAARRIREINPECKAVPHQIFYLPENADEIDLSAFHYVVDCVDTVAAKVELIRRCKNLGIPLMVCMGAARKLDPTAFRVGPLHKTQVDPLAKALRKKLREEGLLNDQTCRSLIKCVWSEEKPLDHNPLAQSPATQFPQPETSQSPDAEKPLPPSEISQSTQAPSDVSPTTKRMPPASNAFVPAAAGIIAGGEVVKDLARI